MKTIGPYLDFNGNAKEAFDFYRSVFGGEFSTVQMYKDMPGGTSRLSEEERKKIMHIALPLGKAGFLLGSDILEAMGQKLVKGNNLYIIIEPENESETERLFRALSEGGKVEMALEKTFWGAYYGSFEDKFGVMWMINYPLK